MMARLIDADALMDVIRQHEYRLATKQGAIDYGMFTLGIQQAVDEQPTVDAGPVVRCRDCKHWHKNTVFCGYMSYGEASERVNWYANDFCSYGEQKEGGGNG